MLTGRDKYADYWVYRGWLLKSSFDAYWWDDIKYKSKNFSAMKKHPAVIDDPQKITASPYNCIDSGSFYITCFRSSTVKEIDKDHADSADDGVVTKVTQAINGGIIGLSQRKIMTNNLKEILNDKC
ncbi:hypothetical protein [Hafnia psychrotolerans]|uniref:Uncharacterized protein n=1 Tax=Hafnia psychrotolerans TaxID=1477018 RepID=A0ABQ1H842_9GAMM|nr:hypothetical protein [Hafnia psychrotolerans]GGA61768.1 hypothetical protein GCM10011328_41310 [Hafnia psychrotolerans]